MSISMQKTRGVLGLVGELVDQLAIQALQSDALTTILPLAGHAKQPYHITVFTKEELATIQKEQIASIQPDTCHIFTGGIGGNSTTGVFFVVIIWAAGQQLRKQFGLPCKHFHITLSVRDKHNMDKSINSLLPGQFPDPPDPDFLDHLIFTLHASGLYEDAQKHATHLILLLPKSHRGFLRFADAALCMNSHKLAMLSFACAIERVDEGKVQAYCMKKLVACSKETEWGTIFQEEEMLGIPEGITRQLITPWSSHLRERLSNMGIVPSLQLAPRQSLFIPGLKLSNPDPSFYKLPRFFRWLILYHFAIMSTPRNEEDISILASPHIGIRHVLTLTEEEPLPELWFRGKPIANTYLPIPNYHPPSIEQMDLIMNLFEDEHKLPMLVHCGGGKGRAGTVAACYLAAYGFKKPSANQTHPELSASEAITLLRAIRPGSIETSQQEDFVSKWCSTIWKRQAVLPDLPQEPPPCPLEIEGTLEDGDLFMLVGLPGSGKSWLSKSLLARDPGWTYISQDEAGSRSLCEAAIGRSSNKRVLLDRCNTAASDRKSWLELASNWCMSPVCIWLDYGRAVCTSRAQLRAGHPTLPPGNRVRKAIDQMDKIFVRPTLTEGFKAIVIVRSFSAAQDIVLRISPPVLLLKFPRTPHIIDFGAATPDDIVVGDIPTNPQDHVVITEKIDGANIGFSLSFNRSDIVVQNRSHYVYSASHKQFKKLGLWLERHRDDLYAILDRDPYFAERYILYGEWMFATHSIPYSHLPDHFIAFDLYDRTTNSWADRKSLSSLLSSTSIHIVPVIHEGRMPTNSELKDMVQRPSKFYDGRIEGIYVKVERGSQVVSRGKVVRSDFIAGNEHWTRSDLRINGLALPVEVLDHSIVQLDPK